MRVLQVMAGAQHGGAEAFFYRLIPALAKAGLHQHAVLRAHPKNAELLEKAGIPLTTASFNRLLSWRTTSLLRHCITDFAPDIVMTWMSRATHQCPQGNFISVARLGGYYDLKYYQKADYLVGNTKDIQAYCIKEAWPGDKTAYLPNFVDEPTSDLAQERAFYKTPEEVPLILTMGRLHEDKAFDILIKALAKVPEAYLWIAGTGPQKKDLAALAHQEGVEHRVRFLGWHDKISRLYKACDLYCCPSRVEPLGNVILEAWAHCKPVVAARSAGPEGLISCHDNGLMAPLEDFETLATHLKTLITSKSLRDHIAQKGRQTYERFFTESKVVDQYLAFFERLLHTKERSRICVG